MPDDIDHLEELIGPGHNKPPSDVEILQAALTEGTDALVKRRDELLGSLQRAPAVIEDEETCGKAGDLVKFINSAMKAAEATRVAKKEPFLQCSRVVDGFFKQITDPLEKAAKTILGRMTIYQRAKAERERQRLEEERRLAEAEAARQAEAAAAAARTMKTEQDLQAAVSAETLAQRAGADAVSAQKAAGAKAADMSRTRGDLGAVGSLRTFWDFKELDRATVDLEALRPYLPQDALEQAVRGYTRANFRPGHPGIQIRGVVIFENTHTRVA